MSIFLKDFKIPAGIKVVSFDIFDTLILTPFEKKSDTFRFMNEDVEKIIGQKINFKKCRKRAEKKARRKMLPLEEIKLEEIYKYIMLPEKFKEKIHLLEMQKHIQFSFPRPTGKELYEAAKKEGFTLIAVTDTYLDQTTVLKILSRNGFEFNEVFVSSNLRKSKHNGNLFKLVIEKMEVDPSQIFHIGDNKKADIKNASKYKIHTFHLAPLLPKFYKNNAYQNVFLQRNNCLLTSALIGVCLEKLDRGELPISDTLLGGKLYNAGLVCFGGLLFGFSRWVYEKCIENDIKSLYFIARDGFIVKKTMEILYPNPPFKNNYLEVSRKSLLPLIINSIQDVIKIYSSGHRPTTLGAFIKDRLECDTINISSHNLQEWGFESLEEKIGRKRDLKRIKKVVKFYAEEIFARSTKEKSFINNFLEPFLKDKNIALCDIGYKGSIQKILSTLRPTKKLFGFYFLTNHKALQEPQMSGFLKSNLQKWKFIIISTFIRLMESSFLSAPYGTTISYTSDGKPIKAPLHPLEGKRLEANTQIWNGALDFQTIIKQRFGNDIEKLTFNKKKILKPFLQLAMQPTSDDAKIFTGIYFENKSDGAGYLDIIKDKLWKPGFLAVYHPYFSKVFNFLIGIILKIIRLK